MARIHTNLNATQLPELFKLIIEHDNERPGRNERVVPIGIAQNVKGWRKRRNELTVSAGRQRGTGASG